jgi:hypothetical protein
MRKPSSTRRSRRSPSGDPFRPLVKSKKLADWVLHRAHKTLEVQKELRALEAARAELLAERRELTLRVLDELYRPVELRRLLIAHVS